MWKRGKEPKFVLGVALIVAAAGMFAAVPLAQALSAHAAATPGPLSAHAAATPRNPTYTCTGNTSLTVTLSSPPSTDHPVQVLSLTWKTVNDEDSGIFGYWAMDSYVDTLHVWLLTAGPYAGQYYVWKSYVGNFQVPQGAISPGKGVSEPAAGYGTMQGGYYAYISGGTFFAGNGPDVGNLGTINYGGTTSNLTSNNPTYTPAWDWYAVYFERSGTFTWAGWGWVYNLNSFFQTNPAGSTASVNQWCNFAAGSYGDIVTAA